MNEDPDARLASPDEVHYLVVIRDVERVRQIGCVVQLFDEDIRLRINQNLIG